MTMPYEWDNVDAGLLAEWEIQKHKKKPWKRKERNPPMLCANCYEPFSEAEYSEALERWDGELVHSTCNTLAAPQDADRVFTHEDTFVNWELIKLWEEVGVPIDDRSTVEEAVKVMFSLVNKIRVLKALVFGADR